MTTFDGSVRISVLIGLTVMLFGIVSVPKVHALTALEEEEMGNITGQKGLSFDLHTQNGVQLGRADYTDNDGYDNGEAGTLRFETVCVAAGATCGNALDLTGFTMNVADGGISVGGNNQSAIVFDLPSMESNSGISVDAIHPGDPGAASSSLGSFSFIANSIEHTTLEIGALGEGILGDVHLDLHLTEMTYTDGDFSDNGTLRIEDIHVDDGSASPGNPAALEGFTLEADANLGVFVSMPSGPFTVTTGSVYPGDPSGSAITSQVTVNDVNLGNTSFEVTPN